jgi:hypothetical protein
LYINPKFTAKAVDNESQNMQAKTRSTMFPGEEKEERKEVALILYLDPEH